MQVMSKDFCQEWCSHSYPPLSARHWACRNQSTNIAKRLVIYRYIKENQRRQSDDSKRYSQPMLLIDRVLVARGRWQRGRLASHAWIHEKYANIDGYADISAASNDQRILVQVVPILGREARTILGGIELVRSCGVIRWKEHSSQGCRPKYCHRSLQ